MKDFKTGHDESAVFWIAAAQRTSTEIRRILRSQAFQDSTAEGKRALVQYALEKLDAHDVQLSCAIDYLQNEEPETDSEEPETDS